MPNFWQFPTVSMGLGPLNAHLSGAIHALSGKTAAWIAKKKTPRKGLGPSSAMAKRTNQSPWARSTLGSREKARQFNFRSQLQPAAARWPCPAAMARSSTNWEAAFRGAGWNVIKVIWGAGWDDPAQARQVRPSCSSAWEELRGRRVPGLQSQRRARFVRKEFFWQVSGDTRRWSST